MGEIPVDKRFPYINSYELFLEELRRRFEPVAPIEKQDIATWKQKVVLAAPLPQASLQKSGITSKTMWDAQIDLWLVRLLADAIVEINEDKDSVTEAVLRRIDTLELLGGDGNPVLEGGGSGSGGSSSGGAGEGMQMYTIETGSGGSGGGGGVSSSVAFDPAQEFGSGSGSGGEGGSSSSGGGGDDMADMYGGSNSSAPAVRYIADSPDAPYMERGFYMSVIIMQKKIPDFIVELANSDWPVRIERFHIGENPHRKELPVGGGRRGYGGGRGGMLGSGEGDYEGQMNAGSAMQGFGGSGRRGSGLGGGKKFDNPYAAGLPEYAEAAMNHPDLVQLDLAGVITMYREPTEALAAMTAAREKMAASGEAATGQAAPPTLDGAPVDPGSTLEDPAGEVSGLEIPATADDTSAPPATADETAAPPDPAASDPAASEPMPPADPAAQTPSPQEAPDDGATGGSQ